MGIRLTNAPDDYPEVFLSELLITKSLLRNVNDPPMYYVSFAFRRYKVVDAEGNVEYADCACSEYIDDYYTLAVAEAAAGDSTLVDALLGDQAAVAKLITDNTEYDAEVTE